MQDVLILMFKSETVKQGINLSTMCHVTTHARSKSGGATPHVSPMP